MKSFIAKQVNSILVNLRYLRFKLLKYKENNKKICNTSDHNLKNIPLYIMRKVSWERYYFVLNDGALTLKMSKMALNLFCDITLQMHLMSALLPVNHLLFPDALFGDFGVSSWDLFQSAYEWLWALWSVHGRNYKNRIKDFQKFEQHTTRMTVWKNLKDWQRQTWPEE